MSRMSVAIPSGLLAGAFVGLMIGGLWLHLQLGTDMNTGHPFVLITDYPGLRRAGQDPWRTAYLIVLAAAALLGCLAVVLSLSRRLTTYGKARFQSRREVRRNGLMQPLAPASCLANSASRGAGVALCSAVTIAFHTPWSLRPHARARAWAMLSPTRSSFRAPAWSWTSRARSSRPPPGTAKRRAIRSSASRPSTLPIRRIVTARSSGSPGSRTPTSGSPSF